MDKPSHSHKLASFISKNVHHLNGKAKYFTVEGDFENIIINKHKIVPSKINEDPHHQGHDDLEFDYTASFMSIIKNEIAGDINEYREQQMDIYNRKEPEANP